MPEYSNTNRVFGRSIGQMKDASPNKKYGIGLTEEQRAERDRLNQKAYEAWKAEREARIERNKDPRLRHKDLIV